MAPLYRKKHWLFLFALAASLTVVVLVVVSYVVSLGHGRWPRSHPWPPLALLPLCLVGLVTALQSRRPITGVAVVAIYVAAVVSASLWLSANL